MTINFFLKKKKSVRPNIDYWANQITKKYDYGIKIMLTEESYVLILKFDNLNFFCPYVASTFSKNLDTLFSMESTILLSFVYLQK